MIPNADRPKFAQRRPEEEAKAVAEAINTVIEKVMPVNKDLAEILIRHALKGLSDG